MSAINHLIAKRANAWGEMQALSQRAETEDRALTAEEREQWDRIERDLEELEGDIRRHENFARRSAGFVEPSAAERAEGAEVTHRSAFEAYLRGGAQNLDTEARQLLERISQESRAQMSGTLNLGGYAVAPEFWERIAETMKAFGGLAGEVNLVTTGTGASLPWPTLDGTANKATIIGEGGTTTLTDFTFGSRSLGAYTYRAAGAASLESLQDLAFDVEAIISRQLGMMFGRGLADHIAIGTGSGQPQGLAVGAPIGVTGAVGQTLSVTYDNLVDLEHSVDPAYRPKAKFALNDKSIAMIRKLKDNQGRPLWEPSLQAGTPSLINGRPYVVDNSLPVPAANAKSIIFGDLQAGYVLRTVANPLIVRAAERYIENGIVAFFGFARFDGRCDDTAALSSYKHSAT
jgi:HK97 family phage major capsid protein